MWNLKRIGSLGAGLSLALWTGWLAAEGYEPARRKLETLEAQKDGA